MSRYDNALDYATAMIAILRTQLPAADQHDLDQMPDGLQAHPTDTGNTTHTHNSPVETTVLRRQPAHTKIRAREEEIDAVCKILRNLERETRATLGVQHTTPRCNATGRDGAIEWSDPTCTTPPSRGPLCDRCSKREYRWRTEHGLPPRSDGVYSAA